MNALPEHEAVRRLHAQYAATRALAESASLAEAAPRILQAICQTLGWQHGALWRVDAAAGVLRCVETWHPPDASFPEFDAISRRTAFPPGVGLPGRVWSDGRSAWIPDVVHDTNFPRAPVADREGLHGAFGFPILLGNAVQGVLEFFSREIRQPDEELLAMLSTIGIQIGQFGERKRAEAELSTLFTTSRDMLCIAGFDGYFRRLNPAWERTLGYPSEDLVARPYLDFVHPEDRDATIAEAQKIAAGLSAVLFENRYRCKDGSYKWLSWNAAALASGDLIYAAARDVTEQKRIAAELRSAREMADAANRAKSDFLANVSHEIRTPMNAVIGMAELLLDTEVSPQQGEYLSTLKHSAESLLGLLNDILDFSKIEAGKLELSPVRFDLREALGDTLKTLGLRAHQKGLELAGHVAPDVPERVVGDAHRLRQVLVNLVGNAIKFTERGEVVVRVQNEVPGPRDVVLRFVVSDTGVGIPLDKQRAVFEAFTQADGSTTRQYGGTGLGLSISNQLVQMMGGRISVDSELGRGSRFAFTVRFELPSTARRTAETAPVRLSQLRVLVVDDNETNRRILVEMLKQWRIQPTAVDSGRAALEEMERAERTGKPYPLVLLDGHMPGMDGFGVAERIQQRPQLAGAAIMMLTSAARPGDRSRALELGIAAHVTKPVKQSDLLDAILEVVAGRRRRAPSRAVPRGKPGPRLRVLVAEDNAVNQQVALGLLERAGHTAVAVANGREVLAALEKERFDIVLMDVQMPEMDGFEATAAIREREKATGGRLPIVAVTAHAMKGDAERCLAAGMDAYLAKPLQLRALQAAIRGLVGAAAVDRRRLLERVGGDHRALAKLVEIFLADSKERLAEIRRAIASDSARALRDAAHALKGAVSNFAAPAATAAAQRLQEIGESGALAQAEAAGSSLEKEIARVRAALEALVAKAKRPPARPKAPRRQDAKS